MAGSYCIARTYVPTEDRRSFDAYTKAAQQFSIADAQLMDQASACKEIDRVLTAVMTQVRPRCVDLVPP
jgi:TPP-dependent 2-oxoacid decarboxylase